MKFEYSYAGQSGVQNSDQQTAVSFSPDVKRDPTYFAGNLKPGLSFREAISALHAVVISDLRFVPKDKSAYKKWLAQQELVDWAQIAVQEKQVSSQIAKVKARLLDINNRISKQMQPFNRAKNTYFNYLYKKDYDAWFVLDPVITVHPDEIFFECFSQDESSYGRLSVDYELFEKVGDFSCGTTNIDYSADLYNEFQKIRTYKETQLKVDPSGFEIKTTNEETFKEVKIDLPDSWIRGFLQVNSAMGLPKVSFDLHPMDIHNLCAVLRQRRETIGPRSMRYLLDPGQPVKVLFDPWNIQVECPRSLYEGTDKQEIRTWGRRRIHILERLIPLADKFTVHLLGHGMPSFYVAKMPHMTFTLALSGWTANDWSGCGNFDLLAPRGAVDSITQQTVFKTLKKQWFATPDALAAELSLERATILGALSIATQAGRAIWDLDKQVYRARELSREPLPIDALRYSNDREESAIKFVHQNMVVNLKGTVHNDLSLTLSGSVKDGSKQTVTTLTTDGDERIIQANCSCNWHSQNQLRKGPCEHILALRVQYGRQRKQNTLI